MITFLIITHVPHINIENQFYAYSPYVREMNIWIKYVDEVVIAAPKSSHSLNAIDSVYQHTNIRFVELKEFNIKSIKAISKALFYAIPVNFYLICREIYKSNHIHLRCPGNIGLLGTIAQLFFPYKTKTAKYAGNWDPKANAPISYRWQKNILSNTFFTKRIQVLVYGDWINKTENIKPFFTATYKEIDKTPLSIKKIDNKIKFIFVGMLVKGKQPLYAIQLIEQLIYNNIDAELTLYGDGIEKKAIEKYIKTNDLEKNIFLKGNCDFLTIKDAYKTNDFVILPSLSEGWPKAIAEGMFWGCIPISTSVSCVPHMLDNGNRGLLLNMKLEEDTNTILNFISNQEKLLQMRERAVNWSRQYTIDYFEQEIKQLVTQ